MHNYLFIFLGAGLGGVCRYAVNSIALLFLGSGFPFGTLAVNIIGSFVMGLLTGGFALKGQPSETLRLFLITGFLGGFTTFSAFSLDAVLLYQQGHTLSAALYTIASVSLALAGLLAGLFVIRFI